MASLKRLLWRVVGFFYRRTVDRSARCSPAEAAAAVAAGEAVLLDVREAAEVAAGLAAPARWIATSEIRADGPRWRELFRGLRKDQRICVYCAAGVRAGRLVERLTAIGYDAVNVGGYRDWLAAGLPTRALAV